MNRALRRLNIVLLVSAVASPSVAGETDARIDEARGVMGNSAEVRVVAERFVFAGVRGATRGAAHVSEKVLDAYYHARFERRPERPVLVLLFPNAAGYRAYCRSRWAKNCISPYGFYLSEENTIVSDIGTGLGTLTHELVHPIFRADFPEAPIWLEEGIASLYEAFALGAKGEIHGSVNFRLPILLAAKVHHPELTLLENLFGMSDETFRGEHESVNYALARYLCLWLDQKDMLWPFYHHYRERYAADPSGRTSFVATVGMTPDVLQPKWSRWLLALKRSTRVGQAKAVTASVPTRKR
jgi:hypothetical protein